MCEVGGWSKIPIPERKFLFSVPMSSNCIFTFSEVESNGKMEESDDNTSCFCAMQMNVVVSICLRTHV